MLKDIIEALKDVAKGIDSVKTIAEAVKSGKDYIETKHPEVRNDLRLLVGELQKSMSLIKRASAVLTNFRFAISASADVQGSELVRFNEYFIQSKTEAHFLEEHIDDLRTHCSKIRTHGTKIGGEATVAGFTKIFTLLGLNSPQREQKLGQQLVKLANDDDDVANSAASMLKCLVSALKYVQNALGVGGAMHPENVAAAAALLAEYGPEFERMEEQAAQAVKDIRELVKELE
jgi:hypothetical protein